MESGRISLAGGSDIAYETKGEGDSLVLIHGGLGDRRMWDDQWDAFAAHHRVIRYDQPGIGESAVPTEAVAYHEDLAGLLHALGIAQAHILALAHPEMVRSLILASSVMGGMSEETGRRIQEADEAAEAGDLDRAVELETRLWIDGVGRRPEDVDPKVRGRSVAMNRAVWESATDVEQIPLEPPARDRLGRLTMPTLVIVGERDVPDVQGSADSLLRELPNARRVIIPDAAHHLHMERPDVFNQAVLDFLANL